MPLRERFPTNISDIDYFRELGKERDWIVISKDLKTTNEHQNAKQLWHLEFWRFIYRRDWPKGVDMSNSLSFCGNGRGWSNVASIQETACFNCPMQKVSSDRSKPPPPSLTLHSSGSASPGRQP